MRRRLNGWMIAMLALIAIGVVYQLIRYPSQLLIPVLVFGAVFLLYKFPPSRFRRAYQPPRVKGADRHKQTPRKRSAPFRVIEGGKDDDDLPKYH